MATQQTRAFGRIAVAPSVIALFLWMIVPLSMTIWFSFLRYNLLDPNPACSLLTPGQLLDEANRCIAGTSNYYYFLTDPAFFKAMRNSLTLVGWVLAISIGFGDAAGPPARPGDLWPQHRPPHGHRTLLRHADGERAGLAEHDDGSDLRLHRLDHQVPGSRRRRLVRALSDDGHRHHGGLAMAALRHAHHPHGTAVLRRRAEGSRRRWTERRRSPSSGT